MSYSEILIKLRDHRPANYIAHQIGVSKQAYCAYEKGKTCPRDAVKRRIADFYGTTVESIFFAD